MHCSIGGVRQDYGAMGVLLYHIGSVYDRLSKLTDVRKARGKLYSLEMLMMVIVMAKLCGYDRPVEIADWAKNHAEQIVKVMQLHRPKMPHHKAARADVISG